jgi:phosphohistidine swiveling domain-containing protein
MPDTQTVSAADHVEPVPIPIDPPPGFWIRDTAHYTAPLTPATAAVADLFQRGMLESCREMGFLIDEMATVPIGGWSYTRLIPVGRRGAAEPRSTPPAWLFGLLVRTVPALRRRARNATRALATDLPGRLVERWWTQWRPELDERTAALRDADLVAANDEELCQHLDSVLDLLTDGGRIHFRLHGAGCVILWEYVSTCGRLLGWSDSRAIALLAGTSTTSTAPTHALDELAAIVRTTDALRAAFDSDASVATVLGADAGFADAFRRYLRDYGSRIPHLDLADPTLAEDPGLLLGLVRDRLATNPPVEHDPSAADAAGRELNGRDRSRFDRLLRRAQRAYGVREDDHFRTSSLPYGLLRQALQEVGRRLTARGQLAAPDDVFMLRPVEARVALVDGTNYRTHARHRAGERAWAIAHPGPPTYGDAPAPPPSMRHLPRAARLTNEASLWMVEHAFATSGPPATPRGPAPSLVGRAASTGQYRGTARIIRDESEFARLRPGNVLVCPITTPVWSILFGNAGALVTDAGGILSHPAIIAREFGIPAVVGTGDATRTIPDGATVAVDGTTGRVEILR